MAKRRKRGPEVKLPRSIRRMFPQVTRANDATESIEVSVCAADVTKGQTKAPDECALAQAIRREYKADGAVISLSASWVIKGTTATRYQTPVRVQREIVSFDRHHDFATGTYYLPPKCPSGRLGQPRAVPTPSGRDRYGTGKQLKHISMNTPNVRLLSKGDL